MSVKKYFHKSIDFIYLLCYFIDVANNGVWLSLVERFVRDEEVACSNHVTPIMKELEILKLGNYTYFMEIRDGYVPFLKIQSSSNNSIFLKFLDYWIYCGELHR